MPWIFVLALVSACRIGFDTLLPTSDAAPACQSAAPTCAGAALRTCAADGTVIDTACEWGCVDAGAPHCGRLVPAGGLLPAGEAAVHPGLGDVVLTGAIVIDGDTGAITSTAPSQIFRTAGTGTIDGIDLAASTVAATFHVHSLRVAGPVQLAGARAIVIVADAAIELDDVVTARSCTVTGLGTPTASSRNGNDATSIWDGGSGGGNGGGGGASGVHAGGVTVTAGFDLVGGGRGGNSGGSANRGGLGGGAIQLVSNSAITVAAIGAIDAGGCGGGGGNYPYTGGGGGAGGTILLEAPAITIAGTLAVNGGGGGDGNGNGANGPLARAAAPGGGSGGGPGGFAFSPDGTAAESSNGGGGGVGRIRIDALHGGVAFAATACLSPSIDDATTTSSHDAAVE